MIAASGRQSNDSMHASYTASEYLILSAHIYIMYIMYIKPSKMSELYMCILCMHEQITPRDAEKSKGRQLNCLKQSFFNGCLWWDSNPWHPCSRRTSVIGCYLIGLNPTRGSRFLFVYQLSYRGSSANQGKASQPDKQMN